jgi:hypothetical protein
MTNLLEQAINCDDPDRAAKMIQDARGIESDNVVNYCLPKEWPRRGIWADGSFLTCCTLPRRS